MRWINWQRTETDESKDFYGLKLLDPLEESQEDKEEREDVRTPHSVSVKRSGKRKVTELLEKPRTRRHEIPQLLLSSNTVTRIRGAAQRCPGGPNSPIKL